MVTPVSRFIELVTICYEENLHIVITIPPSSLQFHQLSFIRKPRASTDTCLLANAQNSTSYGSFGGYYQFNNYPSFPSEFHQATTDKCRSVVDLGFLMKCDRNVGEQWMVICFLMVINSLNPETGVTTQRLF